MTLGLNCEYIKEQKKKVRIKHTLDQEQKLGRKAKTYNFVVC